MLQFKVVMNWQAVVHEINENLFGIVDPVHNVYFVKYDVTVSFLAQVLDTVTYFVSHVLDSRYSDIFWHIL